MSVRVCTNCGESKPLELFAKGGKFNGAQQYKAKCKTCVNAEQAVLRNTGRVHQTNVREEKCPFGKGLRKVSVKGWGYLGATR